MLFNDHIAEVDADAEEDALFRRGVGIALGHLALHLDGALDRIHDAHELSEEAVAGGLNDPATMLSDLRLDQLADMRLDPFVRAFLICSHQPGIAGHVGGEDCGKAADGSHLSFGRLLVYRDGRP